MVNDPGLLGRIRLATGVARAHRQNVADAAQFFLELLQSRAYEDFAHGVRPGESGSPELELFPGTKEPIPHGHREKPAVYMTAGGLDIVVAPYESRGTRVIYSNTDAPQELLVAVQKLSEYCAIPPRAELEALVSGRIKDYVDAHLTRLGQ